MKKKRQIIFDTETTGLNAENNGIIEIAAVEIENRVITGNRFHRYIKPNYPIDPEAKKIHGISENFLADKPKFPEIIGEFWKFIEDAEIIAHNIRFDLRFLHAEYKRAKAELPKLEQICPNQFDTLALARRIYPGKKNDLESLCKRLKIDTSGFSFHSALDDCLALALVFLAMTQVQLETSSLNDSSSTNSFGQSRSADLKLKIINASDEEKKRHSQYLSEIIGGELSD